MSRLTPTRLRYLSDKYGELKVLNDLIENRARDDPPGPILAYPRSEGSVDDYEYFTGKQLDEFVDKSAKLLMESGLEPNVREPVALLAPSNVDFLVAMFALSRLGYTVLCLSLRITPLAIVNLLKQTSCNKILHGDTRPILGTIVEVQKLHEVKTMMLPIRSNYDVKNFDTARWTTQLHNGISEPGHINQRRFVRDVNREEENGQPALIMHSSGSTGLPKPVVLSHRAVLTHAMQGAGLDNFGALPWYHLYGISTTFQAMYQAKVAAIFNVAMPLTADNLVAAIDATRPKVVHAVPYALGLLAEKPQGVARLKACVEVTSAGARTPDELGDRLVHEGVNLAVVFGTTEAGLLGDSMKRDSGDDSWNYVRIYGYHREFLYMDHIGGDQYEAVYLKGHPALSTSNSDEPAPGSWRSKDVFTPHATRPDVWKYVTRIDDRVTLVNGEKVLPLPIEGRLREDVLIHEAVVFGIDRPLPGLLLFRAANPKYDTLSDEDYIDAIWPSVVDANSRAEAFSQITRDMILVMDSSVDFPRTDKGSVIRAQVYKKFADQIESLYTRISEQSNGTLRLNVVDTEAFIMKRLGETAGIRLDSPEADFFRSGVDSLRAIQLRRTLQNTFDLKGQVLPMNVVYECRNALELARYIYSMGENGMVNGNCNGSHTNGLMNEMIRQYSDVGQVVLLTGATGSLGAFTLAALVRRADISRVYCTVRQIGSTKVDAQARIIESLQSRGIILSVKERVKIVGLVADISKDDFGLDAGMLAELKTQVSIIFHVAWPVNFNIPLQSFADQFAGLRNLIDFSLAVNQPKPALLLFCSSVSVALNKASFHGSSSVIISNTAISDSRHAANMGYAQSKWVGEHIVLEAARRGARTCILRLGQIVGDKDSGIWNDKEAIPSMIRSALTLRALPDLEGHCSWLPVDAAASCMVEISQTLSRRFGACGHEAGGDIGAVYNILNPHTTDWKQVLEELRHLGLEFETVAVREWLRLLRLDAVECGAGLDVENPAMKLIEYFEDEFCETRGKTEVFFDLSTAERDSSVLKTPMRMVEDGYMSRFFKQWMQQWDATKKMQVKEQTG